MVRPVSPLRPQISIVVVVLTRNRDALDRCLTAIANQTGNHATEIIVPCDDSARHLLLIAQAFPAVRFVAVSGGQRTYAELRAIGVKESTASIVALTEDHCIPAPDWVAKILSAHESAYAAIGGTVEKQVPDSALNWAFFLADYVRYANPISAGPTNNLTDCNVTYKRAELDKIHCTWQDEFHEPAVHDALRACGAELWLTPEVTVFQQRTLEFRGAMRDRYVFGRLFACTRCSNWGLVKRLRYSLLALPLPVILIARIALHVLKRRRYFKEFLWTFPYLALISTTWTIGEVLGYATGRAEASLTPKQTANERLAQEGQEAVV
jgi:Glycosyl transferase family 2